MSVKIGTATYGGNSDRQKKNYFSIKEGDQVFRILPPLFDMADKGRWSEFYKIEYGYKDSEGRVKPFQDIRKVNFKTKMVEVESAAHLKREGLKAQFEKMKADGAPKAQLDKMLEIVKNYNLDSKHYVNAMDMSGKIGLLKIPYTAKKDLDLEIEKLKKAGVDPLSVDNGRFFVFSRSGIGFDTAYKVRVYTETVDTAEYGKVEKQIVHKLTDDIINRLEAEAFKLDKLFPLLTPEQVQRIVTEGAPAVDDILGFKDTRNTETKAPLDERVKTAIDSGKDILLAKDAENKARLEAEKNVKLEVPAESIYTAPKESVNTPIPETAKTEAKNTEQSEEDFLRSIGAM